MYGTKPKIYIEFYIENQLKYLGEMIFLFISEIKFYHTHLLLPIIVTF